MQKFLFVQNVSQAHKPEASRKSRRKITCREL